MKFLPVLAILFFAGVGGGCGDSSPHENDLALAIRSHLEHALFAATSTGAAVAAEVRSVKILDVHKTEEGIFLCQVVVDITRANGRQTRTVSGFLATRDEGEWVIRPSTTLRGFE